MLGLPRGRLVSDQGIEALRTYQYKSANYSYLYAHVNKPIATFFVKLTPLSIAPNTITLTGLLCSVAAYIAMFLYCPTLTETAPTWVYVFVAVCLFSYQTLDNMDGQQARRTGTSTPLGQLFDHGCDALNLTLMGVCFAGTLQLGTPLSFVMLLVGYTEFWLATWDEYHTGELYMGQLSGPDEGLTLTFMLTLLTGIMGPAFWHKPLLFDTLTLAHMVIGFGVVTGFATALTHFGRVHRANVTMFRHAMGQHVVWVSFTTLLALLCVPTPASLVPAAAETAAASPFLVFSLAGTTFAYCVGRLILSHVCRQYFALVQNCKVLVLLLVPVLNRWVGLLVSGRAVLSENAVLAACLAVAALMYGHVAVRVISEVTDALDIYCFSNKHGSAHNADVEAHIGSGGRSHLERRLSVKGRERADTGVSNASSTYEDAPMA